MEIPTRLVILKATGNLARINASEFDAQFHEEPSAPADPASSSGAGASTTAAPPADPAASTPPDTTPGPVSTVNSAEALELVAQAESAVLLDTLERDERASLRHEGGRKGVLKAIAARRAELGL